MRGGKAGLGTLRPRRSFQIHSRIMESCWRTPSDLMGETKLSPIRRLRRGAKGLVPLFSDGET